ncbi:MAG: epimerase [Porticoccaceae bacterium]|nr:epimerase [Porticoccaceae bacterium]
MTGSQVINQLAGQNWHVWAFTRSMQGPTAPSAKDNVTLHPLTNAATPSLDAWISCMPIAELPAYFDRIAQSGARRIVALSTTSVFTKADSPDTWERTVAANTIAAEAQLSRFAEDRGIAWTILRPTMIYGLARDRNISALLRFIHRFGLLPVLGEAKGLRQPVHCRDVADACIRAVRSNGSLNKAYNISGGEILSYRQLCEHLFIVAGKKPRLITIPLWLFAVLKPGKALLPDRLRWLVAMMERMNKDMIFDTTDARRDLGLTPGPFRLRGEDIPDADGRIAP